MKDIYAYTHTHWDREWYHPFETFRLYLHGVLKQIILDLQSGNLPKFYLDGQAIVIDDALELEPELEASLRTLIANGQMSAGPWYVLPDEFLVCGESLIRNLKLGIETVRKFGAVELVGYSPDTFGHCQDLPRILNGFNISTAFVWRGVPELDSAPLFWWVSPDRSRVLAYHLEQGYFQSGLIDFANQQLQSGNNDNKDFAKDLIESLLAKGAGQTESNHLMLYPIGADHTAPPRKLSAAIEKLNKQLSKSDCRIMCCHLHEFAQEMTAQAKLEQNLSVVQGQLRDNSKSKEHANAFLLQGVLSSRLYLKRKNRQAEQKLFGFAEPLFSMLAIKGQLEYPGAALRRALRLLLQNQPHDSICGCSVDAVHEEMLLRYAGIEQIINPLLLLAKQRLSGLSPEESAYMHPEDPDLNFRSLKLVNPGPVNFSGVVRFDFLSKANEKLKESEDLQILESKLSDHLFEGWGILPHYKDLKENKALIWLEDVPAFSQQSLSWPLSAKSKSAKPAIKVRGTSMDNGILKVSVNERGRISVEYRRGSDRKLYELEHRLQSRADAGDTYNFDPIPYAPAIQAKFVSCRIKEKGPLLSSLLLKYKISIPESIEEEKAATAKSPAKFKRSRRRIEHEVHTELILKRGSKILEFESSFENHSSGQRLEVLLSTGETVKESQAEAHFSLTLQEHKSKAFEEKLPIAAGMESACDRFASQRFLAANGQIFLNKGLPEYAVEGKYIALTLLRSVDILSRGRMLTRGGGAGPHIATPGAQCKGLNQCSYAWAPLSSQLEKGPKTKLSNEDRVECYKLAASYQQEIFCLLSSCEAQKDQEPLLSLDSPEIMIMAAYFENEDGPTFYLRLLNSSQSKLSCRLRVGFAFQSAHLCRLDQEPDSEGFLYRRYDEASQSQGGNAEPCTLEIEFSEFELKTVKFRFSPGPEKAGKRSGKRGSVLKTKSG